MMMMQTVEDRTLFPCSLLICISSWGSVGGPHGWLLCSGSVLWGAFIRKANRNVQYKPLESSQSLIQTSRAFSYHFAGLRKTEVIWVAGYTPKFLDWGGVRVLQGDV